MGLDRSPLTKANSQLFVQGELIIYVPVPAALSLSIVVLVRFIISVSDHTARETKAPSITLSFARRR
jgi:hypothetical protein